MTQNDLDYNCVTGPDRQDNLLYLRAWAKTADRRKQEEERNRRQEEAEKEGKKEREKRCEIPDDEE